MSLQSTVGIARTGAKSLRATVPEGIVAFLELTEGDKLEWRMEVGATGERSVVVRKAQRLNLAEADTIAAKYTKRKRRAGN